MPPWPWAHAWVCNVQHMSVAHARTTHVRGPCTYPYFSCVVSLRALLHSANSAAPWLWGESSCGCCGTALSTHAHAVMLLCELQSEGGVYISAKISVHLGTF